MAETEKEIEIRSLDSESTRVSIATNQKISQLKILLKESFIPAKNSPNFHLFFKGAKMGPECQIDSYPIENHDFIVLVPFTKKNSRPTHCEPSSDQSTTLMKDFGQSTSPSLADSAWSDIMHDLSCMSDTTQNGVQPKLDSDNINDCQQRKSLMGESSNTRFLNKKRNSGSNPDGTKRPVGDFLHDILGSYNTNGLDDQSCGRLSQALDSVDCLSDLRTGDCLLFKEFHTDEKKRCLCPLWLKKILKSFTFLNIFSGLLQMYRKDVTWNHLKGALKQLKGFGVKKINIADVEHLSVLCPKVVMFGNENRKETKLGNTIVVVDSLEDQCKTTTDLRTGKHLSSLAIINAIRKRKKAFEADLWGAIKCSMGKKISGSNMPPSFSLKDLLKYMEVSSGTSNGSESKHARRNTSGASRGSESKRSRRNTSKDSSFHLEQTRCQDTGLLLPMEMIEHLQRGIGSHGQIVHVEKIDARMAVHVELPKQLSEITETLLKGIGISRLYSHQAESIRASLSRKNVVVATSTSSGKSLCYNLPVMEALFKNLLSCALYLFPTKALAQDQLRTLLEMTRGLDIGLNIGVYDGDTSQEDRPWLRDNARLLITNPDMLHVSILPFHKQFHRILSNLRFVIIDEAHTYKGAFGCHTALILRRLRRICCHVYGSDPSFVFCTATSANPREHAMELANLQNLELIQNDGSPCGPKFFLLWNPPLCHKNEPKIPSSRTSADPDVIARRSSPILEASFLFAEMVQHGLRCIAFCKTRKLSELVLCYTREILQETAPHLVDSICAYRAGYTAQDRRRIESDFFGGKLRGVAATNALELGIDVGHIDSTLHLGFPGSVASLWQQAGRSGRRERPSLAVYVAFGGPLDQYFMKYPEKLFRSPVECCQVDAQNQQVLEQHIACASFEHPLSSTYDEKYFGSGLDRAIQALMSKGYLSCDPSRDSTAKIWSYIGHEEKPSHAISIRAIETEKYKVIDKIRNELLEEIKESRAFFQVYEGAVYMHQGKTYLIKVLDLSMKIAFCQEADLKYYTKTRDYTDIYVIGGNLAYPAKVSEIQHLKTTAQANTCKVTTNWFGFYRIWRGSNQIFDSIDLSLPTYSYQSQAVWIRVPQAIKRAVEVQNFSFRAGLHAASHALLNVVPLYIMCNSSDLGTDCVNPYDTRYIPERILLYDQHPGGIGISAQVQPLFGELLNAALDLVSTCSCTSDAGCPSCVQTLSCHEYNEVLDKSAALLILEGVIEAEKNHFATDQEHSENSDPMCNV